MRFLSFSLAGRTVLLVIAVIAVTEIATFSLISRYRRAWHVDQTVHLIAGQIRLLQSALPGLNDESRRRLSASDSQQGLQLRADGPHVPSQPAQFRFARRLADELDEHLGEPVLLRHSGPGLRGGLWIGFHSGGERWWLVLPPPRFEPQDLPPELWLRLAGTLAVVLLIAVLFVRGIVGPLARLGEAVTATGDGAARTVTPEGPAEVRRLAERHNRMLDQLASAAAERREMLAGLTHDLRAPLARLRLRLALLESDGERSGLTRDVDDMERIVAQCLAFLRSEQGGRTPQPLAVVAFLREAVARQRELGRPLTLTVDAAVNERRVMIAASDLQRLLDNLIDNALQHGAPPIEVTLTQRQASTLVLSVRDHGPGIARADREHALEPFAQLEPARATDGSCGLGLAIVRRIVSGCGGKLSLNDPPDGGLEVIVELPAT
ncbi:ATP-binding protein [Accumulibacter sp.]|uniref:ATP-binding protein n=1 Tax=Accumulibacter sp. TaxID=2053492 RepID=UPI0026092B47|nr:ATP-binding protein [Accumulibacter sp.]